MSLEIQHKNQLAKSMLGPTRWLPTWDILIMDVGRFGWWDIFTNNHWDVLTETDWDVLTGGTFWLVTGTPIWSDLVIRVPHRHLADKSTRWQDNSLTNQLADTSTRGQDNSLTNNSLTVNSLTTRWQTNSLTVDYRSFYWIARYSGTDIFARNEVRWVRIAICLALTW